MSRVLSSGCLFLYVVHSFYLVNIIYVLSTFCHVVPSVPCMYVALYLALSRPVYSKLVNAIFILLCCFFWGDNLCDTVTRPSSRTLAMLVTSSLDSAQHVNDFGMAAQFKNAPFGLAPHGFYTSEASSSQNSRAQSVLSNTDSTTVGGSCLCKA